MIIVCSRTDSVTLRAAEAIGIDALEIMDQRGQDYLLIDATEVGIDIVAADLPEAARMLAHMLAHGAPPERFLPPPIEVSEAAWQSRH